MANADWIPDFIVHDPPQGWTGPERPTVPPALGWTSVIERIAKITDATLAEAYLDVIVEALVKDATMLDATVSSFASAGLVQDVTSATAALKAILTGSASDETKARLTFGALARFITTVEVRGIATAAPLGISTSLSDARTALTVALKGWASDSTLAGVSWAFAPHEPVLSTFDSATTYSYPIPGWATHLDFVLIGGGASGQTGSGVLGGAGSGGAAGQWSAVTATIANMPEGTDRLDVIVGAGGPTAPNSDYGGPNNGTPSRIDIPGLGTLINSLPGIGTVSGQNGASPGNIIFNGVTYTGGAGGTGNGGNSTNPPGAGGAGGNGGVLGRRTQGGYGSRGRVFIRAFQM